jgi:XTP/dITP diphosphohydrolase
MTRKIVLASNNAGKLKEFFQILSPLNISLHAQAELSVPEVEETYFTFVENALLKARHASRITGLPALSDDSGLCVNALNGAPGVLSARFAGEPKSDSRNNALLVSTLEPYQDKSAYYYCVLVYVRSESDPQPVIADGCWYGDIVSDPRGEHGFGYDPHFWIPSLELTVAQLSPAQKNTFSHRGQALRALFEKLR